MTKNQFNQRNILATLLWFGLRGRSLSIEEIYRLQYKNTFIRAELRKFIKESKVVQVEPAGKYSLKLNIGEPLSADGYKEKWKVANLGGKLLRFVPFIEMVAVVNSLADQTAHINSDIDFFIVTQSNRLFMARTLATIILSITNLRRRKNKIRNHICLSFFVTIDSMDLSSIKIDGEDIYLAYWVAQAQPIINYSDCFKHFLKTNQWVAQIVPRYSNQKFISTRKNLATHFLEFILNNYAGDLIEKLLRNWQLKRIEGRTKSINPDVLIVASKDMLKFHEIDRRRLYRDRWLKILKKY